MDEFNAEGWIALCHKCGKEEHTPAQHKSDAEKALNATGRWMVGSESAIYVDANRTTHKVDLCTDCAEKLKAASLYRRSRRFESA